MHSVNGARTLTNNMGRFFKRFSKKTCPVQILKAHAGYASQASPNLEHGQNLYEGMVSNPLRTSGELATSFARANQNRKGRLREPNKKPLIRSILSDWKDGNAEHPGQRDARSHSRVSHRPLEDSIKTSSREQWQDKNTQFAGLKSLLSDVRRGSLAHNAKIRGRFRNWGAFFSPIYLRDMCSCPLCVDESSGQKNFCTADIPDDIEIAVREDLPGEQASVLSWSKDVPGFPADHVTRVSLRDLYENLVTRWDRRTLTRTTWTRKEMERIALTVTYESYIHDLATYRKVLQALRDFGLVFLRDVPKSEQSVVNIAEKIGPLRNSFYGSTWDVKSVPAAKNVAYTAGHLGFHSDLLYMKEPPRLQFLHCLQSSAEGGSSLFTDAFHAVKEMYRTQIPRYYKGRNHSTTFHYNRDGKTYIQRRPLVEFVASSDPFIGEDIVPYIDAVNWSPPFQAPFIGGDPLGSKKLYEWHMAASEFKARIENPEQVYERKLADGDCVIFDNRRVLHARTAFEPGDAGKERWLKGCYVDQDPYESELIANEII